MSYYDIPLEIRQQKGIDYDLGACLEYNPQSFTTDDIARVLAVVEGENDGKDWHWIILLNNDKLAYLRGGCDYTGWDCQSWADSDIVENVEFALIAAKLILEDSEDYTSLKNQLNSEKNKTWRERKDEELGL